MGSPPRSRRHRTGVLAGLAAAALALTVAAPRAAAADGPRGPDRAGKPSRAAWSYDLPDVPAHELDAALDRLVARGVTRLYLSVEDGARFRLATAEGRAAVGRAVAAARRRGLAVEAMLLQHPRWLDDPAGALARARAAAAFVPAPGERPFDGLHLDVEPHTLDAWECGGETGRADLVGRLARLAADVRAAARAARGSPVPVSIAVPWWSIGPAAPGGEAAARALAASADTLVLMAYGEPGGPLVGGDADRLLCRLGLPGHLDGLPAGTRVAVGLAGYEYPDADALGRTADRIDARLGASARYAGTALFLDGAPPGTPLVVSIRGRVVDAEGRPVSGARVTARAALGGAPATTTTTGCGRFVLRLARPGAARVTAAAPRRGTAEVTLERLVAGREREMGTIVLREDGAPAPAAAAAPDPALPPFAGPVAEARAAAASRAHDRAEALLRSVLDRWPGVLDARLGLARLDAWRGRREAARAAYHAILAERCDAAEAHLGLADLARWDGRLDEAARHYRAVADGWPHEPAGYVGLARVALDRGRPADARPLLERALALDPSDPDARALLARTERGLSISSGER